MNWLNHVFDIRDSTDYEGTVTRISDGVHTRGINAWLMICSALLASIGLDTNSVAVIIGAMLISPLMSTILGIGYSVGVHDRELFIRSVRNLLLVTFFSFLTAFLYFLVTPLGEPTNEILARTTPTLLDIGVAFFGGVAGMVSGSRNEKTNALPGVAIATALMPPLCASAFGLAQGRLDILGGAFYLFFINAVFIALSTYLMVRLLRFPFKSYVDKRKQRRTGRAALLILLLISIPSIWFLLSVYRKSRTKQMLLNEIILPFRRQGNEVLNWSVENQDSVMLVKAFYSGKPVADSDRIYYEKKLKKLKLDEYRVRFFRLNISKGELEKMSHELVETLMKNMEMENNRIRDSVQLAAATPDPAALLGELRVFYPDIRKMGARQFIITDQERNDTVWMAYIGWDSLTPPAVKISRESRIRSFLQNRLHADSVLLAPVP